MSLTPGLIEIACYMSLALGLKSRIRRSDIGVFPRRSCVLYVPSTRVPREIVACHTSLAQGLGSSFVLYVPSTRIQRDCCVPYVPGTRVKRCCMPYVTGTRVFPRRSYVLYVPS